MAKENDARAILVGPMRFDVTTGSGHTVALDVVAAEGGADSGPSPMELLLVALAGCTGMDVISILRKMRQQVSGYEVHVHGARAETHPRVFTQITVEHIVTGHAMDEAAVRRAVELSESTYCGVSNTLNKTAEITTAITVREG
jgi:putative redox protein